MVMPDRATMPTAMISTHPAIVHPSPVHRMMWYHPVAILHSRTMIHRVIVHTAVLAGHAAWTGATLVTMRRSILHAAAMRAAIGARRRLTASMRSTGRGMHVLRKGWNRCGQAHRGNGGNVLQFHGFSPGAAGSQRMRDVLSAQTQVPLAVYS